MLIKRLFIVLVLLTAGAEYLYGQDLYYKDTQTGLAVKPACTCYYRMQK